MRLRACLLPALLVALCAPAGAQSSRQKTTVVEIIGLRNWTRQMVEDSVAKFAPGVSLADHACAVILRDSVGFADAASLQFSAFETDTVWVVLPVVEPQFRSRIRYRRFEASQPPIEQWAGILTILERDRRAMQMLQHHQVLLGTTDAVFGDAIPPATLELRRAIRARATEEDWALARNALLRDSSVANRTVATLVLSNFADRDSTWFLLAEGVRTRDFASGSASSMLRALARGTQRRVDWRPARGTLEALLGGTNLFGYGALLGVLVDTELDPALGRDLARAFPELLLDHVGARNPYTPPAAHRFLVHASGVDHGRDAAAWRRWLEGLGR